MWRVASSLIHLRDQVNKLFPNRNKENDGTIGDAAHASRTSDHNPWVDGGVVTAMDITHDPHNGFDSYKFAEELRQGRDPRIKYVISNRRIFSAQASPWIWRAYNGSNPHDHHVHISVLPNKVKYDDATDWITPSLKGSTNPKPSSNFHEHIVATEFGGKNDLNKSAYDSHTITDTELGVALPYHFDGKRPMVKVHGPHGSAVASIVDIGPWNTNDPYWQTNTRPNAESGTDHSGRHTNLAGIDLTPALARKVGISGKGIVNWEFVTEQPKSVTLPGLAASGAVVAAVTATQVSNPHHMILIASAAFLMALGGLLIYIKGKHNAPTRDPVVLPQTEVTGTVAPVLV